MRFSSCKVTFLLFVLSSICISPVHAQGLVELIDNPDAAEQFDYCTWQFDLGADTSGISLANAIYDSEEETTVSERTSAMLIKAGVDIAKASGNLRDCRKDFEKGDNEYEKAYSKSYKRLKKNEKVRLSDDPSIAEVQHRISELWIEDQARRKVYSLKQQDRSVGPQLWTSALSRSRGARVDVTSTDYMKGVLEDFDWIDIQRFGGRISNQAWLLVQHADRDPAFQALALDRMTPYLESNGVKKSNYAYLFDRVAVNHGREQYYGTQPIWECTENGLELAPLQEPETVNERRATLGMGTVEESLANMTAAVCGN